jgi:hypothetical protein
MKALSFQADITTDSSGSPFILLSFMYVTFIFGFKLLHVSVPPFYHVLLPYITTSLKICGVQCSCFPEGYFTKAYNIISLASINVCCLFLISPRNVLSSAA